MRRSCLAVLVSFSLCAFVFAQRGGSPSSNSSSNSGGGGYHSSGSSGSYGGSSSSGGGGGSSSSSSSSSSSHSSSSGGGSSSASHSSSSGASGSHSSSASASSSSNSSSTSSRGGSGAQPNFQKNNDKSPDKINPIVLKSNLEQQKGTVKVGETVKTKQPNRFIRFFIGKHENPEISKGPRPCVGKNCPPPPKPCKGAQCPPPPPPNPPACGPGLVSNGQGGCVVSQRLVLNDCTNPLNTSCPQWFRQNDDRCAELLRQLSLAAQNARSLEAQKAAECSQNPQGTRCFLLTQQAQQAEETVASLRHSVSGCSSVGMLRTMPFWPFLGP